MTGSDLDRVMPVVLNPPPDAKEFGSVLFMMSRHCDVEDLLEKGRVKVRAWLQDNLPGIETEQRIVEWLAGPEVIMTRYGALPSALATVRSGPARAAVVGGWWGIGRVAGKGQT